MGTQPLCAINKSVQLAKEKNCSVIWCSPEGQINSSPIIASADNAYCLSSKNMAL